MGCNSPRVGHCDARMPRSVRYVRTRPVLLPSPGVYGRLSLSARLVAVRTFCLALFLPRKAPSGKLHNPCAFRAVCADPPLRCAVNKKSPLRRWEPPKGDFCYAKTWQNKKCALSLPLRGRNDAQNFMHRICAFRGTMPMLKFYVQQRELAVSRRICCICGHCASMFAASRSCARQRSRFCVGRSILK